MLHHGGDLGSASSCTITIWFINTCFQETHKEIAVAPLPIALSHSAGCPHVGVSVKNLKIFIDSKGSKYSFRK